MTTIGRGDVRVYLGGPDGTCGREIYERRPNVVIYSGADAPRIDYRRVDHDRFLALEKAMRLQ